MSRVVLLFSAILFAVGVTDARASIRFDLNYSYNFAPGGVAHAPALPNSPWVFAQVYDSSDNAGTGAALQATYGILGANEVFLVVKGGLSGANDLQTLGMNFVGSAANLTLSVLNKSGFTVDPDFQNGTPTSIDSSASYDFHLNFYREDSFDRFDGSDQLIARLAYTGSISASNFLKLSTLPAAPPHFYAAAVINGIANPNPGPPKVIGYIGADSYTVRGPNEEVVPEPATLAIWSLGLGIAGLVRLRRKS